MALRPELKQEMRLAVRHPIKWARGADEPPERIHPWEMLTHIIPDIFLGFRNGFHWQDGWLFQNVFHILPSIQAVATVATGVIDGVTDPVIGAFMDTKSYKIDTYRWFARISMILNPLLHMIPMFYMGLSPWQRVALIIALRPLRELIGTPGAVANQKIWAHITDSSLERYRISWAAGLGEAIHEMIMPLTGFLIGMRYVFDWSPYSIIVLGSVIFAIPAATLELTRTCVLQRVPDKVQPKATEEVGVKGFLLGLWECFQVTRHNRFFWLDNFASLLSAFNPTIAEGDFFRFSGVAEFAPGEAQGEVLEFIRNNVVSLPTNFIMPFAIPIIKKVGGPRNLQVLHEGIAVVAGTARAIVGVSTFGGLMFHWTMETFIRTFGRVNGVANRINEFEMLDYVEWKTGRRSEGANMAINGLKRKIITNNIDAVSGRLFTQFVLGFDPALGVGDGSPGDIDAYGNPLPGQPERYMRYMPLMYLWLPILNSVFRFLSRLLYKYPASMRDQVEADLIERRRLAEEAKQAVEAEEEAEEVGV